MQARIYLPTKSSMQSVKNPNQWILEFITISNKERFIEHKLGRISSNEMLNSEVFLKFKTKQEAVAFAIKNNYHYELIEPNPKHLIKKTYASNFK